MSCLSLTETIAIRNPFPKIVFLLTYRALLLIVSKPTSRDQFPKSAISVRLPFDHHSFIKFCWQHATNISVLNVIWKILPFGLLQYVQICSPNSLAKITSQIGYDLFNVLVFSLNSSISRTAFNNTTISGRFPCRRYHATRSSIASKLMTNVKTPLFEKSREIRCSNVYCCISAQRKIFIQNLQLLYSVNVVKYKKS